MQIIKLKKNEDRRVKKGHLWIFSNEIERPSSDIQNGDLVYVHDSNDKFVCSGFFNRNSLITVRVLSREQITDLKEFFRESLIRADNLRKSVYPERKSYRMIFSESDFLPGLIIDKYNYTFVLQLNSFGMQKHVEHIVECLVDEYKAKNIFTKHDMYFRKLEGLEEIDELYLGTNEVTEIVSDGSVFYSIDFIKGQKTGFFFDQVDNRLYASHFCKGKTVADVFCNSGGFGLNALKNEAENVTFVDYSKSELENVEKNLSINNFYNKAELVQGDAFEYLEECSKNNKTFDVVMVDPPAFTKNKKNLPIAKKGYERLNMLGLRCVKENGIFVSSSCSHHLSKEEFLSAINNSAARAGKKIQLLYFNSASLDHPSLPSMEETAYLKFAVFSVV